MSGNPFRRSQAGSRLPDETSHHDRASTPPLPKTRTKKKRVVIQTPPHSPEEPSIPRRLSDGKTGSPPPPRRKLEEDYADPTGNPELDQAQINARRNSGPLQPPPTSFGVQPGTRSPAGSGAPFNPFARTLATSEAAYGLQRQEQEEKSADPLDVQGQARPGASRTALDVDAFKNILMTGSAAPTPPVLQQSQAQRSQDGSSSTDTSSISRHSMFDQLHDAHPESPRTSFEDHHAPDDYEDDDDENDNEHSSLMGPVSARPVAEGPPPPPKHKHGKAYPQTVNFADFDDSLSPGLAAPVPVVPSANTQQQHSPMRPSTPMSLSDLNKPLPLPPTEPKNNASVYPQNPSGTLATNADAANHGEQIQPKRPPPPPVSRRQGPTGTAPVSRARSTSEVSQGSTNTLDKAAPPPPPTRRAAPVSHSPSPSPAPEVSSSMPTPTAAAEEPKAMPPPPPRRMHSKTGTSITRTPSNASRQSLPRNDSSTALHAGTGAAPPAPPPRRGAQSKRNSSDGRPLSMATRHSSGPDFRRASGHSVDSDRSASLSSIQQSTEPTDSEPATVLGKMAPSSASEIPQSDILADMSAFQAEIDALRFQQAGRGG